MKEIAYTPTHPCTHTYTRQHPCPHTHTHTRTHARTHQHTQSKVNKSQYLHFTYLQLTEVHTHIFVHSFNYSHKTVYEITNKYLIHRRVRQLKRFVAYLYGWWALKTGTYINRL